MLPPWGRKLRSLRSKKLHPWLQTCYSDQHVQNPCHITYLHLQTPYLLFSFCIVFLCFRDPTPKMINISHMDRPCCSLSSHDQSHRELRGLQQLLQYGLDGESWSWIQASGYTLSYSDHMWKSLICKNYHNAVLTARWLALHWLPNLNCQPNGVYAWVRLSPWGGRWCSCCFCRSMGVRGADSIKNVV